MKWFFAGITLVGIGALVYFYIMFQGPRMQVQPHIRAYQGTMPLPPKGIVPVEQDRYEIPSASRARGMKNLLPDTPAIRDRGKVYYNYYCTFCHGKNGQGDGPVGYGYMPVPTDLHAPKVLRMTDGDLMRAMLIGIGHEPVLPRVVFPEHRWYLVSYIRTLGKTRRMPAENQGSQVILRGPETR
jgi:mono/diheme cytochrome c family protein